MKIFRGLNMLRKMLNKPKAPVSKKNGTHLVMAEASPVKREVPPSKKVFLAETDPFEEKDTTRTYAPRINYKELSLKGSRPGNEIEAEITKKCLPLVKQVAGRVATQIPPHVDIEDLYSSGLVGLLNAIRNYDPNGGSTFQSYARVRIRGAIMDELRRLDWVPRSIHDKARQVQRVLIELEQEIGRTPTNVEMAERLKIPLEEYEEVLERIRPATFICLDSAPCADEEGETTRYESIMDLSQEDPGVLVGQRELSRIAAQELENMGEMRRKVIDLYYFEHLRLREIADIFGVTESRICQLHADGIQFLRERLEKHEKVDK